MEYIGTKKEKITFREIVLTHLSKILELSCDEFRGGYWIKKVKGDHTEEVYIPDSRKRIMQAIEFFSYILQPYFDKEMQKDYPEIRKDIEENLKKFNDDKIKREEFVLKKLKLMKNLFEELCFLLQRKDYLKARIYTETQFMEEDEE